MKIFFDNIIFSLQKAGGISIYWHELLKHFITESEDVKVIEREKARQNIFRKMLKLDKQCIMPEPDWSLAIGRYLASRIHLETPAIFHSSYYRTNTTANVLNVITVYDFIYEYYRSGIPRWLHGWQKRKAIENAAGIICISENTRNDLIKFFPNINHRKVTAIPLGVGDEFFPLKKEAGVAMSMNLIPEGDYILYLGSRSGYKNFHLVVDVLARMKKFTLVMVGGGRLSRNELNFLQEKMINRYLHLPKVDSPKLNVLFNYAFCLVYPSAYEGFGIPILEAMKAGCPVVTTNVSSLPEVCGDAALKVDKICIDDFEKKITDLEDSQLRANLVKRGFKQASRFTWDRVFEETKQFYRQL